VTQSLDGGGYGWPPAQAPPQLPARRVLQLGEKGFCPGGRASGSERGGQKELCPPSPAFAEAASRRQAPGEGKFFGEIISEC